ncbi:MAG: zinc ribbon domain-containing protein [Anaerolineae bacterium]|nr:MAG: zinc ribbon domain-containing protein [Anaerolineae bacterium]
MRIWLTAILLLGLLLLPMAAQAQGQVRIASLEVNLWPEYDKPEMLVIYYLALPADLEYPLTLTLRVPSSVKRPHVVAIGDAPDTVSDLGVEYSVNQEGEWTNVVITVTAPFIQLEYYDPGLKKDGDSRHFVYEWPGDYAVDDFGVRVQQPAGAENLQTDPPLENVVVEQDTLTYHFASFGSLQAGEPFNLELSYQKGNDTLTVSTLQVQPGTPLGESAGGRFSLNRYLPWILGGVGIALILGGGLYFWQSSRPAPSKRKRHATRREAVVSDGEAIYCHQCGKRAQPGDRFCRACGTRLRRDGG